MKTRQLSHAIGALALSAATLLPSAAALAQDNYIGEIRMAGFGYCPRDWAEATGQLLAIQQYQALYSLFGTTYGGDGRTNFALPDLRSRSPVHTGQGPGLSNIPQGQKAGTETITMTTATLARQTHTATSSLYGTTLTADSTDPSGRVLGMANRATYVGATPSSEMQPGVVITNVAETGASQPVASRNPYLAVRFCVALNGI